MNTMQVSNTPVNYNEHHLTSAAPDVCREGPVRISEMLSELRKLHIEAADILADCFNILDTAESPNLQDFKEPDCIRTDLRNELERAFWLRDGLRALRNQL